MGMRPSLRKLGVICVFTTAMFVWLLIHLKTEETNLKLPPSSRRPDAGRRHSGFLINTDGCHIPDLDPFDPSIRQFIFDEEDPQCKEKYGLALVDSNSTSLFINESTLYFYNVSDISELSCCYTPFWRIEVEQSSSGHYPPDVDSHVRFADNCTEFTGQVEVADEFVKIQCFLNSSTSNHPIFTDFHSFIPPKNLAKVKATKNYPNEKRVSVLIVGVDSVSRLNLHRQMPLTVNFLKNNLSAVELLGYNKVEDNTFLNLIPVLTGLFVEELQKSCSARKDSVFDNCRYVWDNFSEAGYATVFSEDCRTKGGIFSYRRQGFRKQPTDFYTRPLYLLAELDIGFNKRWDSNLCLGPRKSLNVLLNYAFKAANTMQDILSFIFVWGSSLTHDFINLAKKGDVDHAQFLEKLYNNRLFDKTVLVFMSDHGMRFGKFRQTYQGHLEERLPFLFVAFPSWFRQKYPNAVGNLRRNAQKLTTPFDLHETLLDLVNLTRLEDSVLRIRSQELDEKPPRGISLFLPIPESRVCKDAGIDGHWCTCQQSKNISTNDGLVISAANYLVRHINSLVKDYPRCAILQLHDIKSARQEIPTSHRSFQASGVGIFDYSLIIETTPGEALFESTIRYNEHTNYFTVGIVSRINVYGNQSSCISHFRLRLYCYCI